MKDNTELYAKHLGEMITFPTVSCVDANDMDMPAYLALHAYLEQTYPLVHQAMKKEVIGRAGLLYYWKGSGKSGKLPLMLTAHLDVVPEGDHAAWKYPPFSGQIAEGFVWGRGATDSKCNIQAYMDALESLIAEGFTPEYDLYFGFGYNEEVSGCDESAADLIAGVLRARGVQLGCLLDECGGIQVTAEGEKYGFIYTSEKGYADFEFSKEDTGGHSGMPVHGAYGAVSTIGKVAAILDENPLPARLIQAAREQLQATVPYMKDERMAGLCKDVRKNWDELLPMLESDRSRNPLIRTTTAVTMAGASVQANVLPEKAWIVANNRLLPGDTIDDLWEHYRKIIPEGVAIKLLKGYDPPPAQSTDTEAYRLISSIMMEQHPGISVIPCMLYGGTDSRFYCDLCPSKSVYRVTGLSWDPRWDGLPHKVNERIPCDILSDNVEFYRMLFTRYGK